MANKKINQLVSKTAILSTDIFGIGDATTGQLFKKTIAELQAAIGGAVISVNGLVGTVVLDTDDIQELVSPTNKWFTDARARSAISLTVTGSSGASTYNSGTGVLNVPTYTLAGLGGITATFLSGTSGISYNSTTGVISYSGTVYTDASIRALLSGSTGISYNSTTGAISYSGTVYTDSSIRALLSLTTTGSSGASTYNSITGVINVPNYTLAGLGGISLTSLSGGTGITYNSSTGQISYSGTVYTDASVRALLSAGTGISYNSTTGVITSTITQYTDALARASVSLTTTGTSGASTYNSTTGVLNIPQYQSVLTNPVTGTGTTNYHAKWTSSSAIGDSLIYDNGSKISIGTTSPEGLVTIKGTSAQPPTSGTTANSLLQLVGSLGNELNIGSNTVTGGYGSYIQASDNNLAVAYPLLLQPNGGNVGIGTSSPVTNIQVSGSNGVTDSYGQLFIQTTNSSTADYGGQLSLGGYYLGTSNSTAFGAIAGRKENGTSGSALGYLSFSTQNGTITERMRITSAGNVGIGTSSPSGVLHVIKDGAGNTNTSITGSMLVLSRTTGAGENIAFRNTGTSAGISGTTYAGQIISAGNNIFELYTDTTSALAFGTNATERMRITSGGNILMGTTSDNGERLYVSGAIRATSTITANSDISLKKNLLKIENALEKVEQINGYTYEFKEDDSKRHAGVIAQEIQTVLPEIVNKGNDGILGVEYGNISALLIEAIKEQQTQINELKALLNK
jgi:hypothetical protein